MDSTNSPLMPFPELLEQRLIPRPDWDEYFLAIAKLISTRSTCSSRPVGCVIVRDNRILVSGYNGAPPGAPHCTDRNVDGAIFCARRMSGVPEHQKLDFCPSVHAEENALTLADKLGVDVAGSAVYTTLAPCVRCIERLRSKGVRHVYYELAYRSVNPERDAEWEAQARGCFETYKEVRITEGSVKKLVGALMGLTSERLLPSG